MAGNGRAAGAVEHGEEGPFRADCRQGVGIVDRGEEIAGAAVVSAGFDPDRTLPHRRQKAVNLEDGGRGSGAAEPVEPGQRQQRRIDGAIVELLQAGLHIAAERLSSTVSTTAPAKMQTATSREATCKVT